MPNPPQVIAVNYHRIGAIDPRNPFHRLHTVPADVFASQLQLMQTLGNVVSPDQARKRRNLAQLNFVVCFDDVSVDAAPAIELMRSLDLPVTVSVCGQLASHGWGTRDKVYAIEKFCSADVIDAHIQSRPSAMFPGCDRLSFYHLTKSADLNPGLIVAQLIDPLFQTIEEKARPYFDQNGYLSWHQIRRLAEDPGVTLANHTYSHDNLAALSHASLDEEIGRSHLLFAQQVGRPARWFTLPFGRFTQQLALDCLPSLAGLGYAGMLWVGPAGTVIRSRYRHQLLHLTRLHAEDTEAGFAQQIAAAQQAAVESAVWQVPATIHRRPVTVVASSDARRSCLLEMVMRQGKDYASDPRFYRYQFTDNPYKRDRPDFYAVECDGRIESTAYNFHTSFNIGGTEVPGVYLSSWRKLPEAHPTAAARLLHKMTALEPVVGVHNPNPAITSAFAGWKAVAVHQLSIAVPAAYAPDTASYLIKHTPALPEDCAALCADSVRRAGFTVARDGVYHRWRHDSYPLARSTYTSLYRDGQPVGVAATLRRAGALSVADFHLATTLDSAGLLQAVVAYAASWGAHTVIWQTSSAPLVELATRMFTASVALFNNFYHLNIARLAEHGIDDGTVRLWDSFSMHETGTTGDVLIR